MKNNVYQKSGAVEYQMPKKMAQDLIKASGKSKDQINIQEYLVNYINNERGLLRNCIKVILV